ncbi:MULTISPECIES: penicillin-insensitive murein endopeptidase [Alphaproteobacteria]|uniref:penicillin-insensitive murein endopeptidase n=1 Tax=Alphaproteobacteria TaxID=28211 RepID=UPI0025486AC4|nr:penicillin-insensitive murein endopeptidase [Sphingomonas psychrolutea]
MTKMVRGRLKAMARGLAVAAGLLSAVAGGAAAENRPAKELFGGMKLPARAAPSPYGSYAKGCIAGAVAIPSDGPNWQAMRPSRNRRWGHPQMISLIERLSKDAPSVGWPGILIGDISQPRGGPMLNGHASHQIGLDADIWLTPMPDRRMSAKEREDLPFTTMLKENKFLTVNDKVWTLAHARLIMLAASYPQVERVFVNPAIKKKLCDTWTGDRTALGKVRPIYGHDAHFHIRIKCPQGASGCKPQAAVPPGDGCDKSLAWWFTAEPWAKPKKDPNAPPPKPPRPTQLSDLPKACAVVLQAPAAESEMAATYGGGAPISALTAAPAIPNGAVPALAAQMPELPDVVPIPLARPAGY